MTHLTPLPDPPRRAAGLESSTYIHGALSLAPVGHSSPPGKADVPSQARRREYECVFMRPGIVLQADGQPSRWLIPAEAIRAAAPLFSSVASYLDHPALLSDRGRAEPQVRNLVGVTFDARWDEEAQALVGGLRLYDQEPGSPGAFVGALLDQMLADREKGREVPPLGLSAVFFHRAAVDPETGLKVTKELCQIESVDLVYAPGAGGYVRRALAALCPGVDGSAHAQPERSDPMSQENPTFAAPLSSALLSSALLSSAPLSAEGTAPAEPLQALARQVDGLSDQVAALSGLLAQQEESRTVQGLGDAPRDAGRDGARVHLGPSGLEQIQAAVDWVFGAPDTPPPPPDLRRTDRIYYLLTGDGGWTGVFQEQDALAAANPTTLPGMAVNAMNKVIVPLYERLAAYRWYEQIVSVQPTNGSLHDMAWIQFGGIGDLPIVADGAAYTELSVADSKETDAFTKYGGYVGITEKMLRNSDIAQIQAVPRALTIAAVQTRSARIAALFTANSGAGPTLDQDSTALFHANHGNLDTTAFSYAAWAAARLECYKQTELGSGKRHGLWPKFWLGPADLYDTALTVFGYGAGPGGRPGEGATTAFQDVNPYAQARPGDPRPIPIAVPDFTDTGDWAYIADPTIAPVIQMAYADNPGGLTHPTPTLYLVTSPTAGLMFSNDVLPIKVRDYFAYGVATYRGIGKRNVA